ncbi:MAG: tetratricopeptide repeat protein [Desulfobacterium sp.]|nr:tetratricopeptide repeat protein [Desulfobacterium sp.]
MKSELRRGNLDSVGGLGQMLLEVQPENPSAMTIYSIFLTSKGEIEQAKSLLQAVPDLWKSNFFSLCAKAMIKHREKKYAAAIKLCKKAVSLDETHPYPSNIMGRVFFEEGKFDKALASFNKAIELNSDFLPGFTNLGATYYMLENYAQSINAFKRAIKLNPDEHGAHYGLALAYGAGGNNELAIGEFKKCLELKPKNPVVLSQLGNLQLRVGLHKDAQSTGQEMNRLGIDEAYTLLGNTALKMGKAKEGLLQLEKAPPGNPEVEYLKGYCYMAEADYEKALSQMEKVLQTKPSHFGAYSARGALEFCLGRDVNSLEESKDKWGISPGRLLNYISATIYASKGDWVEAEKGFKAAEGLISGFSIEGIEKNTLSDIVVKAELIPLTVGVLCYFKGMYGNASSEFEKARIINPDSFLANYWAAQTCLAKGDREKALQFYNNSIRKAPRSFAALYAIGELNYMKGNVEITAEYYKRALEVKKDSGILIKLGVLYEKTGKIELAEEQYKEVIKIAPDLFVGYNQLAWLYAENEINLDKAMKLAKKADELQPENASILDTIGWIFFQKNEYKKASEKLEIACKVNPNNPTILYHLGVVYSKKGDDGSAKESLQKALKLSSQFKEADKARELLKQLG